MNDPGKKKSLGCFGTGCLILIILAAIAVGLGAFLYHTLTKNIRYYTSGSAQPVVVENVAAGEYDSLVKRMGAFKKLAPGSNSTLSISAHDLNVLVACSPEWSAVRGKIRVTIENGVVGLVGNIPLSSIPNLRDKYWNGALYFTPSIMDKVFRATIQGVKSNVRQLPNEYVQVAIFFLEPNLNNRLLGDPVIGTVIIKAETLKIENDALVFTSAK